MSKNGYRAVGGKTSRNYSPSSFGNLLQSFTSGDAMTPQKPVGLLFPNLLRCDTFVRSVVPLTKIRVNNGNIPEPGNTTCLPCSPSWTRENKLKTLCP